MGATIARLEAGMRAKKYSRGFARAGLVPLLVLWMIAAVIPAAQAAPNHSDLVMYVEDVNVSESGGNAVVPLRLSAPAPTGGVSVRWYTLNGSAKDVAPVGT